MLDTFEVALELLKEKFAALKDLEYPKVFHSTLKDSKEPEWMKSIMAIAKKYHTEDAEDHLRKYLHNSKNLYTVLKSLRK